MSKITIIGTSGAGKTVFITVLAERYSKIIPGRPYMEYSNAETKEYSASVWGDLVDKQEWPVSTPAGTLPVLEWVLRTPSGESHDMHVLDAPGQDIQAIYMPRKDVDGDYLPLSENQEILKASIDKADVLILLVNLCDVANAKTIRERTDFEVPIVMAAKSAFSRRARVAVLFSQHDQLRALLAEKGIKASDPMAAVREYLPGLAATIHNAGHSAYVGFVAAVAETEPFTELAPTGEVITLSRPKKGFASEGLDSVMAWMSGTLRCVMVETRNEEVDKQIKEIRRELSDKGKEYEKISEELKNVNRKTLCAALVFGVIGAIIGLLLAVGFSSSHVSVPPNPGAFVADRDKALRDAPWRNAEGSWGIRESFIGPDDVYLVNKSEDVWVWVKADLTPNNYRKYSLSDRWGPYYPGSSVDWRDEHNFRHGDGELSVRVKTQSDVNDELRKQKESHEAKVEQWECMLKNKDRINQEIDEKNSILRMICLFVGSFGGIILGFLRNVKSRNELRLCLKSCMAVVRDLKNDIKLAESKKIK